MGSVKISPLMANIICFLMANEARKDSKRENYPGLQQLKDDCATAAATITRRYRRHHPKLELLRSAKSERASALHVAARDSVPILPALCCCYA